MKKLRSLSTQRGFTLIELLVVIGILTVLLAIVLVAINPQQQFRQANNTQRRSDVNAILNAVHQYSVAPTNRGALPQGAGAVAITGTAKTIMLDATPDGNTEIDLCAALVTTGNYIADLPLDPTTGTKAGASTCAGNYDTQYTISQANNRVTVAAPDAENGETISVTR